MTMDFMYGWQYSDRLMKTKLEEAQSDEKNVSIGGGYPAAYGMVSAYLGTVFSVLKIGHPEAFEDLIKEMDRYNMFKNNNI